MEVTKILLDLSRSKDMNIIMVSHDLNIAAKYSDRVVMMHQGKIFRVGTPAEVITSENLRTVYDVEAEITEHCGRPYVLLNGPL
jgi:iron complex transport system ATP-binding protein